MKKKIVISTLIVLSFLMITVLGISPSNAADKKEFLIGSVGAMSGPGAMLGKNLRIGVEFAVEEINKTGGINGMKVRAIFRDDEADPTKSLTLVRELVEKEKINAFIDRQTPPVQKPFNLTWLQRKSSSLTAERLEPR